MLTFPPWNPGWGLLFLKWVTKKNKHLEGQIYPAVRNIWDLACRRGNLFVCEPLWVALLSAFAGCLLCILYRWSSLNFWVLGSSWMVCITAFASFWHRCQMFLNLTQTKVNSGRLDPWHGALQVFLLSHFTTSHSDAGDLRGFLCDLIDHTIKRSLGACEKSSLDEAPAT